MSGKPVESLLLSIGTRALFGFTVGLLYKLAKSGPHPIISIVLVTSVGRTLHSAIVYIFMGALFPESGWWTPPGTYMYITAALWDSFWP